MSAAGQRISEGVGALLAVSVSVALGVGVFASVVRQQQGWFLLLVVSVASAAVTFAAPRLVGRLPAQTWNRVGLACLLVFASAGLVWALAFSSMQGSDFGVYYRCGMAEHASLRAQLELCQSKYLLPTALFWTRSILYTVPFGALVGDHPEAFDVYNALLNAASLASLFFFTRKVAGPAAATIATLALGVFPERIFGITLATSDNLAVLLCVALLALLGGEGLARRSVALMPRRLDRPGGSASASGRVEFAPLRVAALAALLFGLDLLRGAGQLFAVASLAAALMHPTRRGQRLIEALAAVVLSVVAKTVLLRSLPLQFDDGGALRLISGLDLGSLQDFGVGHRWGMHVWPAIPPEERTRFGLSMLRTELSWHVGNYPRYAFEKAVNLFAGNGNAFFSANDLSSNPDTALTVPRSNVPWFDGLDGILRGLVVGLSSASLISALRGRRRAEHGIALAVVASFFGLVLLLWEPQPRYVLLISPALAMLVASPWTASPDASEPSSNRSLAFALLALVVGVLALGGLLWVTRPAAPLLELAASSTANCGRAEVVPGLARAKVVLPSGVSCAAVTLPLPRDTHEVQFMVTRAVFPYLFEPRVEAGLSWTVADSSGELALDAARWQRVAVNDATSMTVVFSRAVATEPLAFELADVVLR
ncbi:MAG: hypothetical protein QM817_28885 [Archangium sp.]